MILFNDVREAVEAFVPPLAMGSTPVTPELNGRPVKLVATPDMGVPSAGAVNVGLELNTNLPPPVAPVEVTPSSVTCPATDKVPFNIAAVCK